MYFCPPLTSQQRPQRGIIEAGGKCGLCAVFVFLTGKPICQLARQAFSLCTQLLPILFTVLVLLLVLAPQLRSQQRVEWENNTLFCFASFRTQRCETDWQSDFQRVCDFHCSPCFYSLSSFPCTIAFSPDSLTPIITMPVLLLIPAPQLITATG